MNKWKFDFLLIIFLRVTLFDDGKQSSQKAVELWNAIHLQMSKNNYCGVKTNTTEKAHMSMEKNSIYMD